MTTEISEASVGVEVFDFVRTPTDSVLNSAPIRSVWLVVDNAIAEKSASSIAITKLML
jgi:hypothetical protein